jgi:recombinational DNA repair protein (RecF pathway)
MRRIVRAEAICLRVQDYHESSKLVTFFTLERGKVNCLAKGARRLRSKFGAALDIFAQSRIIYYLRETRDLYTLSDAELVHSFSGLVNGPERFLAAEQMAEFALRVIQPHDPSPQLYRLLLNYLTTLERLQSPGPANLQSATGINRQERQDAKGKVEMAKCEQGRQDSGPDNLQSAICNLQSPNPYPALVCSFLLKAASFLGFRPELRRCLICRRPIESSRPAYFESGRGGIICPRCAGDNPSGTRLDPAGLDTLAFLLYTPAAEIAHVFSVCPQPAIETNHQERQDAKGEGEMTKCEQRRRQDPDPENLQSAICSLQSPLDLVLGFLGHHFDPLVLNSFRWHAGLERNV